MKIISNQTYIYSISKQKRIRYQIDIAPFNTFSFRINAIFILIEQFFLLIENGRSVR